MCHNIHDFLQWLHYFPPLAKKALQSFGARIDWRRQFVTTDANPYFDSFVRWQMNHLKKMGKIIYGKRYTVYSPKDGQACLDHDRSSGEGVNVQEYTALKLKVLEWPESAQKIIQGKIKDKANVYFIPATLRPETMYGQTCCFVSPTLTYGVFEISDTEYYVMSERSARNIAFQNVFPKWGEFPKVAEFKGADVLGALIHAPLSVHEKVRILPMDTIKDSKGTAVVTCVPSDSPDDYAMTMELRKKAEYYHIKKEWAELDIIPIIQTPSYGDLTAKALIEQMKITTPKDPKLAEAKELAYKEGFYQGKMLIGDFKGDKVEDAKNKVRQQLIDAGDAFAYAEPDGLVISRSADVCVAALLDQWFLDYGSAENGSTNPQWYEAVIKYVKENLETFYPEAQHSFVQVLNWLANWACARSYGLGSKLPWDHSVMVESLSDSTIYMSYYTIAHYLHKDLYGNELGLLGIKAEQMTDEVWDYIFGRGLPDSKPKTDITSASLETMRRSFEYWYPLDSRISGKDLVNNHLVFCLYIHAAMFPKARWPQAIRINGHLLLNGEKMSKSTGNFLTLQGAVEKFGADATRIALADAGDAIEDANFDESVANAVILKVYELKLWMEAMVKEAVLVDSVSEYKAKRETKPKSYDAVQRKSERVFWDDLFENEMNGIFAEAKQHYISYVRIKLQQPFTSLTKIRTSFKLALKASFYDFTAAR
jgi:leucyl-tRNA synthetase